MFNSQWYLNKLGLHSCNAMVYTAVSFFLLNFYPIFENSWFTVLCSVQFSHSVVFFATPWTTACQASLSITDFQSLLKLMSIESVMPSNHLTLSPLSPPVFNQSFPASSSFPMCWLFASDGQSIGSSTSATVLPMNIQGWFPLGLTDLIFLLSKGLLSIFSSTTIRNHQSFSSQPSLWSNSHICTWLLEKPYLWLDGLLLAK